MNEIIERMARAGFSAHHKRKALPASKKAWAVTRDDWIAAAAAMTEAIREPTDEMLRQGEFEVKAHYDNPGLAANEVWAAMHAEMLREPT